MGSYCLNAPTIDAVATVRVARGRLELGVPDAAVAISRTSMLLSIRWVAKLCAARVVALQLPWPAACAAMWQARLSCSCRERQPPDRGSGVATLASDTAATMRATARAAAARASRAGPAALALLETPQQALGVHIADLQHHDLAGSETCAVSDAQGRLVLEAGTGRRFQQAARLLGREHTRQRARLVHAGEMARKLGAVQRGAEEATQRRAEPLSVGGCTPLAVRCAWNSSHYSVQRWSGVRSHCAHNHTTRLIALPFSRRTPRLWRPSATWCSLSWPKTALSKGGNLTISGHFGEPAEMPKLTQEVLAFRPDVVVASSLVSVQAMRTASSINTYRHVVPRRRSCRTRPGAEPCRPGTNVTGLVLMATELGAKRVALLRELLPSARRLAILAPRPPRSPPCRALPRERVSFRGTNSPYRGVARNVSSWGYTRRLATVVDR